MRRWLARCAIAFPCASVGLRSSSRSVSRTQLLASRNVGVGISCSMSGSCDAALGLSRMFRSQNRGAVLRHTRNKKGRPVSRLPLEPSGAPPVQQDPADSCIHRLLGRGFRHRNNRYESAAVGFCTKLNMTFDLGEQRMVSAHADIKAGMPGGAGLTRDDVAGDHMLATIGLDSEALACRITTVTR